MENFSYFTRENGMPSARRTFSAPSIPRPGSSDVCYRFLANEWTFWYYEYKRGVEWEQCQHEISSFRTLDQFFILHSEVKYASEINLTCDYAFFKHGIRPMWEDAVNCWGGRWVIDIDKNYPLDEINVLWTNILLALFGEQLYGADRICGAVFSNRAKRTRIAVWMKRASDHIIQSVGNQIRRNFHIADDIPVVYEFHSDSVA